MQNSLNEWLWQHALGTADGVLHPLPRGAVPPKAAICTLLFNPIYKFILIKNTKVAGTSVFVDFGGFCRPGITLEEAKVRRPLWHRSARMQHTRSGEGGHVATAHLPRASALGIMLGASSCACMHTELSSHR